MLLYVISHGCHKIVGMTPSYMTRYAQTGSYVTLTMYGSGMTKVYIAYYQSASMLLCTRKCEHSAWQQTGLVVLVGAASISRRQVECALYCQGRSSQPP